MIALYAIIAIVLGLIAIILSILRFRDGKMSFGMLFFWILIWIVVIIISIYPNITNIFAVYTGIGRGLDFVLILGLILSFYMIFKMYNKIGMNLECTSCLQSVEYKLDLVEFCVSDCRQYFYDPWGCNGISSADGFCNK